VRRRPPLCSRWRDERLARMHRRGRDGGALLRVRTEGTIRHGCPTFRGVGRGRWHGWIRH